MFAARRIPLADPLCSDSQPLPQQTRRQDARVIHDEHVAGFEKFRELPELRIEQAAFGAAHDQHPRVFAPPGRILRHQFRGKTVIEIFELHMG